MNKIIITAAEWDEILSIRRGIPNGECYDWKDVSESYYDALMDWAYAHRRNDIIRACPDAFNCPRSFDEFWENILYVEGQDD